MKKLFLLLQLLILHSGLTQTPQIELLLPHSEYTKPNSCYIGERYALTYNEAYRLSYCSFDLGKMQFLNSGFLDTDSWSNEYLEIGSHGYTVLSEGFGSVDQDLMVLTNEADPEHLYWEDRKIAISLGESSFYEVTQNSDEQKDIQEKSKPISNKIAQYYFDNWKDFRFISISPNAEHIAMAMNTEVLIFNVENGDLIWTSPKMKSLKTCPSFRLLDNGLIVLPENFIEDKAFEVTWYDYKNEHLLYSTSVVSGGIFVGEYQGMHYYTFATGDPETGKIARSQYINLKTGEFSEPKTTGRRQRYTIGHHIVDEVLKQEFSQAAYERFIENYTQYSSLTTYFSEFYAFLESIKESNPALYDYYSEQGVEDHEIVKTKLTPMTLPTFFFKEFPLPFTNEGWDYENDIDRYQLQYVYEGKATLKKNRAQLYNDLRQEVSKKIIFWNSEMPEGEREVWLVSSPNGTPVFITPDNYFFSTKDVKDFLAFKIGDRRYSFEQFDLKYNRPDIVLERLGYADSTIIKAYHSAYLKRLEKLGYQEEMLDDKFDLPTCHIKNIEDIALLTDQDQIELNIEASSELSALNRLEIWINNVPIYGSKGMAIKNQLKNYSTTVKVPLKNGINNIKVAVMNDAGAQSIKEELVVRTSAGKTKSDLYIVSLGVSKYEESAYDLTYAAKDAKDIAKLFKSKDSLYGDINTLTLVNEQVRHESLKEITAFLKGSSIDDQVILFVAGHGVLDANYDYYLATHDMNFNNPKENGIKYSELEAVLDGIQPINKLLLLDACHGGEFDKEDIAENSTISATENGDVTFRSVGSAVNKTKSTSAFELSKKLFVDLRKGTGATVISSSGGFEFAIEGADWNNGLFTYCLINGLKDRKADLNGDGQILIDELHSFVSTEVFALSGGMQKPTSRRNNSLSNFQIW